MNKTLLKLALYLNYFVFAILLCSMGIVILQVQRNFDITSSNASVVEAFKDLPIAITSFIVASFLPKIGLKKSMLIGSALVTIACFLLPFSWAFWNFKLFFLIAGASFALVKISVFAVIGIITKNEKEHSSFMSTLEAVFMAGVLFGNFLISQFVDDRQPTSTQWLNGYWVVGALSIIGFLLLFFSQLDESQSKLENRSLANDFKEMLQLIVKPLTIVFIISVFFYVLLEQSFTSWFPTFYKEILNAPSSLAIQAGAILAGATFIGRLISGYILLKVKWIHLLSFCLLAVGIIVLVALPMAKNTQISIATISWFNAPLVVYLMPMMGLFLAPIYPTLNSTILSAMPKHTHSSMSGLIVVFSALGGTTGSIITGHVFHSFNGTTAFYLSLIPITVIFVALLLLNRMVTKNKWS
ncbi:MAG: MFS transporter [Flavobacteriales bacterium]|nr:MFS transporter [Flavobacteriales bacterium]